MEGKIKTKAFIMFVSLSLQVTSNIVVPKQLKLGFLINWTGSVKGYKFAGIVLHMYTVIRMESI